MDNTAKNFTEVEKFEEFDEFEEDEDPVFGSKKIVNGNRFKRNANSHVVGKKKQKNSDSSRKEKLEEYYEKGYRSPLKRDQQQQIRWTEENYLS